uniref:C2H2-type domain-containing protein n=1 Tax=Myripristis murdjan TaxID=586833 RepID=A0A667Z143_9TELE
MVCDEQKNSSLSPVDDQNNVRKDNQDDQVKEIQQSTHESAGSEDIKVLDSQDATHEPKEYTCTTAAASSAAKENDGHSLESNDQDSLPLKSRPECIISSGSVEESNCESVCTGEDKEQSVSSQVISCVQPNNSSVHLNPCLEKEWTSPAVDTNSSPCPDEEQLVQQSHMAIEPSGLSEDGAENLGISSQELNTSEEVLGMLYGEPLSREDSPCEADETNSKTNQVEGTSVAGNESETIKHLEVQSPQLKCSLQMRKRLQPVVILKTLEPGSATNKAYHCAHCQHTTETVDNLIEHHHCSHSLHKFRFCPTCNVYLMSNEQVEKHFCGVTDEASQLSLDSTLKKKKHRHCPYKCNKCMVTFSKLIHYIKHMRTHTGKTPFKCDGCGLYFAQSSSLHRHQRHERNHRGERPYRCLECGKGFKKHSYLSAHKMVH